MPARFSKPHPQYLQPVHIPKENPRFEPIPHPQPVNCNLPLAAIYGDQGKIDRIDASGQIVFHAVGDTGGINGTDIQEAVAEAMEAQIPSPQNEPETGSACLYNLGDVIYYNGLSTQYDAQFYEPYKYYPGPIVAIPGNHDGDTQTRAGDQPDYESSLYGFFQNFCTPTRVHNTYRDTMTQPYVYWRLDAPFVTIIGLYGNVDGLLDGPGTITQQQWLIDTLKYLKQANESKALIIAVHQPPYSLDGSHGGYPSILDALDAASRQTGVWPHAVLSGHVHDYQRFHRTVSIDGTDRVIPYVVAGAGGYARTFRSLHKLQRDVDRAPVPCPVDTLQPGVSLRGYNEIEPGFLRVTVSASQLKLEYFTIPFDGGSPSGNGGGNGDPGNVPPPVDPAPPFDSVTIDLAAGTVLDEMDPGTSGAA